MTLEEIIQGLRDQISQQEAEIKELRHRIKLAKKVITDIEWLQQTTGKSSEPKESAELDLR